MPQCIESTLQHTATPCNTLQHPATELVAGIPQLTSRVICTHYVVVPGKTHRTHKSVCINKSLVNPKSTSNQSSKPCTVLQYPSRKASELVASIPQLTSRVMSHILRCSAWQNTVPTEILQYTATRCNTLQRTATHYNTGRGRLAKQRSQ